MCRVEAGHDLVPVAVLSAELVGGPAEFEPVTEEMMDHVHAATLAMLQDDDGDAGGGHPGHEAFQVREPFFGRDVIERMGAEHQIALGRGLGGQDRLADGLRRRNSLSQLI